MMALLESSIAALSTVDFCKLNVERRRRETQQVSHPLKTPAIYESTGTFCCRQGAGIRASACCQCNLASGQQGLIASEPLGKASSA